MRKLALCTVLWMGLAGLFAADFKQIDIRFMSQEMQLAGSLYLPTTGKAHAVVVFVHGSGKQVRDPDLAERFVSQGIAAFVYDKRGVGFSGGFYEGEQSVSQKNINLLAQDAAAACDAMRVHPRTKDLPLGLTGISQAGWIVPIAAKKAKNVQFMVLWSAPVCKVSEEDIYSKYTSDKDADKVPSYEEALKSRKTAYVWPSFLGKDPDSAESLAKLKMPGLWIFGGRDGSIPVDLSITNLKGLIDAGHAYEYVLDPKQGHNNMGATFEVATDWIKGKGFYKYP